MDGCNQPRYKNEAQFELERNDENRDPNTPLPELIPHKQIAYTSLAKALTELWADDDKLDILNYGHDFLPAITKLALSTKTSFSAITFVN